MASPRSCAPSQAASGAGGRQTLRHLPKRKRSPVFLINMIVCRTSSRKRPAQGKPSRHRSRGLQGGCRVNRFLIMPLCSLPTTCVGLRYGPLSGSGCFLGSMEIAGPICSLRPAYQATYLRFTKAAFPRHRGDSRTVRLPLLESHLRSDSASRGAECRPAVHRLQPSAIVARYWGLAPPGKPWVCGGVPTYIIASCPAFIKARPAHED